MNNLNIIIAEDDNWYTEFLEYHLTLRNKHNVSKVKTAKELFNKLKEKPNIITLDYNLPDKKGDEILKRIKAETPETAVILVSGQNDIETALKLINDGAFDYIVKNDDAKNRIARSLDNYLEHRKLKSRIEDLQTEVEQKHDLSKSIIGNSKAIYHLFKFINKAISSSINVSITGDTGTGKELVAKAIHFNSKRAKQPFIPVNLSAIPESLMESELFGHEKGSFTGADKGRTGKFEAAGAGTIFLDEIGEISLSTQVKILRVLQEREITKIGSNKPVKVNCRIICATNKDLSTLVQKGGFREDLYYRLIGLPIHLPELKNRDSDIIVLAKHFINDYCEENKLHKIVLNEEASKKLLEYDFPGNVRELKSIMELGCVMTENNVIKEGDLIFNKTRSLDDLIKSNLSLKEINEKIIIRLLNNNNNNILKVADQLKIGKSTIYRLLKELKIEEPMNEM